MQKFDVIVIGGGVIGGTLLRELTKNSCPRGKMYAENEVVCPKRVVTSTMTPT